jgi:hypothetical protein
MAAPAEWFCRGGRNGIFTVVFPWPDARAWQFFNPATQPVAEGVRLAGRSHKAIAAREAQ